MLKVPKARALSSNKRYDRKYLLGNYTTKSLKKSIFLEEFMKNLILKGTPSEVLFKLKTIAIYMGEKTTVKELLEVANV